VEFRILGPVELWANGIHHDLGSRKERCVLAVLLWELGRPLTAETLVSRIWGDEASDRASELLYQNVSRLRKSLRRAGGTDRELPKRPGSYALEVSRQDVDAWRFRDLRDKARGAAARGEDELAVALYGEADALWRGVALDGLDGDWVEGVRTRLNEERLSAAVQRIWAGLRLGRHADLVGEIADLVRQYPLDERLLELHLRALYGSGRPAEALAAYHQAEHRWREDSGSDLGRALRDLHRLMLLDDPTLMATGSAQAAPNRAAVQNAPSVNTIPRDNPEFTGRAAELGALSSWLDSGSARSTVPVAVISGMPGVGKTTFAVHAAHLLRERYPDRLHLPLHGHHPNGEPVESAAALGTLLRMLGVPDSAIPADTEGRVALWRSTLNGRKALIMLDDALDADQVLPLLPGTPGCLALVTTGRRTLSLPGMQLFPLEPLPHGDAVALFTRTAGVDARETADRAAVARVVRMCGYVPLRIMLAGRRLRIHPAWSVSDLASRLHDAGSGEREMTAEFALSYRYLTADEQRLFRRLVLHPDDTFSPHAAAAMAGDALPGVVGQTLEVLLDHYLIEEPVTGRFRFHTLIREYAAELADVDSEQDQRLAMGRLLDYYLGLVDRADLIVHPFGPRLTVPDAISPPVMPSLRTRRECVELLEADKTSLLALARHAAATGWPRHAGLLAHLLGGFLDTWGEWADAIDLHRRAIDAWRAAEDESGEATALVDLGFILCRTGQHAEAADHVRAALTIARATSDQGCEAAALDTLGVILCLSARYAEALACQDQAIAIWRDIGDKHGEADSLNRSAMPAARLGKAQDALRRAGLALAAYREVGDLRGETNALNNLGGLQQDAHCYDEALGGYERALANFREIGDRQGEAIALSNIGDIRRLCGNHQEAIKDYRTALSVFTDIGDRRSENETLNGMAAAFAAAGDHLAALGHYEKALALASELAEPHSQAVSHLGIGEIRLAMGHSQSAADDYRAALKLSQEIADPGMEGHALYGLGCALHDAESAAAACEHWRAALVIFEATGNPEADEVRTRLEASVT